MFFVSTFFLAAWLRFLLSCALLLWGMYTGEFLSFFYFKDNVKNVWNTLRAIDNANHGPNVT